MAERLADALWQPWLLGAFLFTGLWCSLKSGFFQLFGVRTWLPGAFRGREGAEKGGLTQLQALCAALASTIGTGSVAGVATAICLGGPGAVFWMWVSALLGTMTSFAEKYLAVRYRVRGKDGWEGGPMEYLPRRLGWTWAGKWFALWCTLSALTGGALVQANSISSALGASFGCSPWAVGVAAALGVGVVSAGGLKRVGRVSEALVPAMAGLYLMCGLWVILDHRAALPAVLRQIVTCALTPRAAAGGGIGYALSAALRYGVARGVFTNEAGVGSSAMAYASAGGDPVRAGYRGMFETAFATLVVCSVTALAILTSGTYDPALVLRGEGPTGAALAGAAFSSTLGRWGGPVLSVCLLLFAFTSLMGWEYYGERGLCHLAGQRGRKAFRLLFLVFILLGAVGQTGKVWALNDLCIGCMALPNLPALLLLSKEAVEALRKEL